MQTIAEKIAYLRGIVDGDSTLQEGRLGFMFGKILEVLDELARQVDELAEGQEELDEYLQEMDFDLGHLEDEFFEDDDDEDDFDEDDEDWEESGGSLVEVECPQCGEMVTFDEDFLFDQGVQIRCPHCDAVVLETDDFEELDELLDADGEPEENE